MSVPHASLKVYEPLEAFEPDERESLLASASVGAPTSVVLSRARGLQHAPAAEHADVINDGGEIYVCPHRNRLRFLASLVAFQETIPDEAAGAFMPVGEADRAVGELETLHALHPTWRTHILTSAWEVPVRWFVAFSDDEREHDPSVPTIRYRTTMEFARARTVRALSAARSAMVGSGVTALVSELAEWLDEFDEGSIVELDYGDLGRLVTRRELRLDHSALDIEIAVTALGEGDVLRATSHYMRAAERWAPLSGLERNN